MNRRLLLPLLLCAPFLLLQLKAQQGPFVLTKYVDLVGEVELGVMTMNEFQERHKIVRQEQHVFDLAMRAAAKQWAEENSLSFPRNFSKPTLLRLSVETKQADAMKEMAKMQQTEKERQAVRARKEKAEQQKNKGGKKKGGKGGQRTTKTDMEKLYKQQREARKKAKTLVQDKMDEYMGKMNSAHVGRMRPEDVLRAGRPK